MPGKKITRPIVSRRQQQFMGAKLRRKKAGKKGQTDMTIAELRAHLQDSAGKDLPERSKGR